MIFRNGDVYPDHCGAKRRDVIEKKERKKLNICYSNHFLVWLSGRE